MSNLIVPVTFRGIDRISSVVDNISRRNENLQKTFNRISAGAAIGATAIAGGLTMSVKSAVEFQDKLADVAKTTGLEGKDLEDYGNSILKLAGTTRSSVDDIVQIGVIGGQLGIAKDQLEAFTISANKFAVALGGDYSGGVEQAISSVGKLNALFRDTKNLNPAESLNVAGSMINELTNMGVKAENINDFALRIARLPEGMRPSLETGLAVGAMFEKMGTNSEVASSGFSNLLLTASKNLPAFAKQMQISSAAASELLSQNPVEFASKFSRSFKGMKPEVVAMKLDTLKIKSSEVIGAVSALAGGQDILSDALKRSSYQFSKATSLTMEYATKNSTVAAKLKIAENNFQVMSITLGTQLLPLLAELLDMMMPIATEIIGWIKENPKLAKTLLIISVALYALVGVLQIYTAVQTVANIAALAFPGTWIALAIMAVIAAIVIAIIYFDDFGQVILAMMGPLGWFIMLMMKLPKYWENIVKAFESDGIIGAFKEINRSILDLLISPVEQLLRLVQDIPMIGGIATTALSGLNNIRERRGMEVTNAPTLQNSPLMTSQQVTNTNRNTLDAKIGVDFNDPFNRVSKVSSSNSAIPVKVTKTNGQR